MARLRDDELRRLMNYLSRQIQDAERLAEIEDALSDEHAEEFLREPDLLIYFPEQTCEVVITQTRWQLRAISHAYLRMVQRGISLKTTEDLFRRFIEQCQASEQVITTGPYTIFGKTSPRGKSITLRVDIDAVTDDSGRARVVTVFVGRSGNEEITVIDPV